MVEVELTEEEIYELADEFMLLHLPTSQNRNISEFIIKKGLANTVVEVSNSPCLRTLHSVIYQRLNNVRF